MTNTPMGAVEMRFPTESDAFGSMKELIAQGLEEDAILQAKQDKAVPGIVDQVEQILPGFEADVRSKGKKKAAPKSSAKMSDRDANSIDVSGKNGYNIQKTAEENFSHLMEALGYDLREGASWRYRNDVEGRQLRGIEKTYRAATVKSAEARNEYCDAVRRAGEIAQREVSLGYDRANIRMIDTNFYTAEMLYIEAANRAHGLGTQFFVDDIINEYGNRWAVNGYADTDSGVAYVKYNAKNGRDDTVKSTRKFNARALGRMEGVQSASKNARHERFHLLDEYNNIKAAQALVSFVDDENGKYVKVFDNINYWYQVYRKQDGYEFSDYSHEIAADLYAGTLILEDKSIWKEVNRLISAIDKGYSDTVSPGAVDDKTVKYSERDDARTDRELLLDSLMDSRAELTDKERQALAGYRQKADDVRQREQKVKDALQELDRMVKAGASREAVNKQRTKVSNLQAGLQKALRELTQAETTDKTMLEIIRKEREIQRRRTAMRTRETFTRRELRGRITKLYNDLNRRITNPSEMKNIPPAVMQQAIEVLRAINMDSTQEGSKAGEKLRDKLLELRARYQALENDPDFKAAAVYDPVVAELLENMIENVGDTPINKMSASQMQAV